MCVACLCITKIIVSDSFIDVVSTYQKLKCFLQWLAWNWFQLIIDQNYYHAVFENKQI